MGRSKCEHELKRGLRLCSHCGSLLGSVNLARRVHTKLSQLARFGMSGCGRILKKAG